MDVTAPMRSTMPEQKAWPFSASTTMYLMDELPQFMTKVIMVLQIDDTPNAKY